MKAMESEKASKFQPCEMRFIGGCTGSKRGCFECGISWRKELL